MDTTYDVRIWKTEIYRGKRGTSYYARWRVAKKTFRKPFGTRALADSFRSDLMSAARRGEAFGLSTGLPVSWARNDNAEMWYTFACRYTDMKWKRAAATSRRSTAEAMVTVTSALLSSQRGRPELATLRSALLGWGSTPSAATTASDPRS
jgi:hypothetical protein